MTVREQIGDGHWIEWARASIQHFGTDPRFPTDENGDRRVGFTDVHLNAEGKECGGWIPLIAGDEKNGWTVESVDPLTISPSLLCRACGSHGFIRQGRWVPA